MSEFTAGADSDRPTGAQDSVRSGPFRATPSGGSAEPALELSSGSSPMPLHPKPSTNSESASGPRGRRFKSCLRLAPRLAVTDTDASSDVRSASTPPPFGPLLVTRLVTSGGDRDVLARERGQLGGRFPLILTALPACRGPVSLICCRQEGNGRRRRWGGRIPFARGDQPARDHRLRARPRARRQDDVRRQRTLPASADRGNA